MKAAAHPDLIDATRNGVVAFSCVIITAVLASCATVAPPGAEPPAPGSTPAPPPATAPAARDVEPPAPKVNLSGFPLPYRQGYSDGCASATGPERKDAGRFAGDMNYRMGWQDGRALCKK